MEIADSARKHQVPDADMLHAVRLCLVGLWQDEVRLFVIGPSRTAELLEIVIVDPFEDDATIIHAMPLREKFYYLLLIGG